MPIIIKKRSKKLIDIKFADWVKNLKNNETKEIILLAFFVPKKYNSFTLSFTDGIYRIRKNFLATDANVLLELKKWYKIAKQAEGRIILTVQKRNEEIILDIKGVEKSEYIYAPDENGNLILKRLNETTIKEDIPF